MIKERRHRKQIVELTTVVGVKIVESDEIQKEIITFYQSLMGTAMTNITAVNDLLMFAKRDPESVHMLQEKFNVFTAAFRLLANLSKSAMYFGGVSEYDVVLFTALVR
ncbi:hypothetical protein H5410_011204 [Solanum commersonii]|uniref:Uncharacterized protein n=1 Tax=Solanum commersonii TaxID=4109 RepID=A0A9J6APA1_SOLCO|nr:hypothetical protein H5410_011204 [Solanum commersonii]